MGDVRVGDIVQYASQEWRVVGANDRFVWLLSLKNPTWAEVRADRMNVQPVTVPAEKGGGG